MTGFRKLIGETVRLREEVFPASVIEQDIMETVQAAIGTSFNRIEFQKNHLIQRGGSLVQTGLFLLYYEPTGENPVCAPNCKVGFCLCSPDDEFTIHKGIEIAEEHMWFCEDYTHCRVTEDSYVAPQNASKQEGIVVIPRQAADPLYRFLANIKDLLGEQAYYPRWAWNFIRLTRGYAQKDFTEVVPTTDMTEKEEVYA